MTLWYESWATCIITLLSEMDSAALCTLHEQKQEYIVRQTSANLELNCKKSHFTNNTQLWGRLVDSYHEEVFMVQTVTRMLPLLHSLQCDSNEWFSHHALEQNNGTQRTCPLYYFSLVGSLFHSFFVFLCFSFRYYSLLMFDSILASLPHFPPISVL